MNEGRASADVVRAAIARAWLGPGEEEQLGEVVLRPHQHDAVARLRALLDETRGAMLADGVGLGKTFAALATARHARRLLVVAPAALREMWEAALTRTRLRADILSFEALSRGATAGEPPDFVIVDEAHHVRTVDTRRYRALAALCTDATTLLLTATPVHNRAGDLRAQLALFLGNRAWTAAEPELARYLVKRESLAPGQGGAPLPEVDGVHWIDAGDDAPLLEQILALPPAAPAADAGDGGILLAISLVRQWASSRNALRLALMRRLGRADALAAALESGRHPTRAELRAWHYADGALQLAFPEIVSDGSIPDTASLRDAVAAHRAGVAGLLARTQAESDRDDGRAGAVRLVRSLHPGERLIVFAEYSATVEALYSRLAPLGGVAMLTDRGGRVSSGPISRRELLDQMTPGLTADHASAACHVTMLVTTDLLSEGVNLQGASVVVHADLPWSPARFEQRVGRVRRMGSRHARVTVYALRPPAPTDRLLRLEARLRGKITTAARAVGVSGTILPRLFAELPIARTHATADDAAVSTALRRWHASDLVDASPFPAIAAVQAPASGIVAAVRIQRRIVLVCDAGHGLTTATDAVARTVAAAGGRPADADDPRVEGALEAVRAWIARRSTTAVVELASMAAAPSRRRLLCRVDSIIARSPRHLRAGLTPVAQAARRAATTIVGAAAEHVIEDLADSPLSDAAWLSAVRTFAQLHARDREASRDDSELIALLVLLGPAG